MQAFKPPLIQSVHLQNYGGHPQVQCAETLGHYDHSTHSFLIKILNSPWQLISFQIISSMRIVNNPPLNRWENWSTWAKTTTEGGENE